MRAIAFICSLADECVRWARNAKAYPFVEALRQETTIRLRSYACRNVMSAVEKQCRIFGDRETQAPLCFYAADAADSWHIPGIHQRTITQIQSSPLLHSSSCFFFFCPPLSTCAMLWIMARIQ